MSCGRGHFESRLAPTCCVYDAAACHSWWTPCRHGLGFGLYVGRFVGSCVGRPEWASRNAALSSGSYSCARWRMTYCMPTARVTTTPASGEGDDYVPPVLRPFTVVEVAQAGLLWRVARQKFGLRDEDPLVPPGAVEAPDSPAAARPVATVPDGVRKVKVSEVLDQGDDGVIPKLEQCEVDEFYHQLENRPRTKSQLWRCEWSTSASPLTQTSHCLSTTSLASQSPSSSPTTSYNRMAHFGQWRCRDPQTSMPGCPRGMCSRTPCSCWRCRSEHRPSAKQSWPRPHSTCIATASAILWGNTPRSGTSWPRPKTGVEQNTSRDWSEDSRRTIGRVSNRASTRPLRGTACSGWPRVNATILGQARQRPSPAVPCYEVQSQGTSWRHGLPHRHCQGWSSAGPEEKIPPTEAAWKPSQCPGQGKRNQCQRWGKKDRRRQRRGPRTKTRCPRPVRHRPRREPNLLCVLRREVPEPVPQEHVTRLPKVPGKSSHPGLQGRKLRWQRGSCGRSAQRPPSINGP